MNKRTIAALVPIVMVNAVSVAAQYEFWRAHLSWPAPATLFFSLSLESLAVFTAFHASLAALQNDSALRLRLASYGLGIIIGLLNASHYLHNGNLTAAAIGVGILSASSPWLWAVESRRASRDKLRENGLIEPHSVRLGAPRWIWHFSRTLAVYRSAIWTGQQNPQTAISEYEEMEEITEPEMPRMSLDTVTSRADAIRVALAELGESENSTAVAAYLRERGWNVDPAYVRQVRANAARKRAGERRKGMHALPVRATPGSGDAKAR